LAADVTRVMMCMKYTSNLELVAPGKILVESYIIGTSAVDVLPGAMGGIGSTTFTGPRPKVLRLVCSISPSKGLAELQVVNKSVQSPSIASYACNKNTS
jgi:hypothetical protein